MTNEKPKQCKTKDCYNPVLDGEYCVHCEQKRKERSDKIWAGAAILGGGVLLKAGVIKQIPKMAVKVLGIILKK